MHSAFLSGLWLQVYRLTKLPGNFCLTIWTYPPGRWFFYEQILQVPKYIVFEPDSGDLEVHRLDGSGKYELRLPDEHQRYWIAEMGLSIGLWRGKRENRDGFWLRWWTQAGDLLLWGFEQVEQERVAKESALQRLAEMERRLRDAGID
ncbi:MAG: Uma2 family endonuclease [Leptolyngbyaceae cyanobacterium MO_188.B28]|nr:Uma2 family endonuclease [Leptolyngbyaceae cyanobacterium MO_188.B28]